MAAPTTGVQTHPVVVVVSVTQPDYDNVVVASQSAPFLSHSFQASHKTQFSDSLTFLMQISKSKSIAALQTPSE
jgi:hypothetical protein